MDFRMRTLKENKNNYNSLVQLQRPSESSFARSINHSSSRNNLHEQQPVNDSFDGFKLFNGQNNTVIQGINQRIGQLEQKVDRIYLETMGLSHKGDCGKDARNSLNFQNSSYLQQSSLFRQSVVANIAMQKQEMQTHGARYEELEGRQARLQQRLRDWMNSQKQEISYRLHTQTEEMKGAQLSKIKRYDYQYDNIKNIIHEMQLKLETDIQYKFKALTAVKQDFSHSINSLREELSAQLGQNKQTFTSFVRDIKQSFQSFKEALNKDRQNVKQAILELQSNGQSFASKAQKGLENATRTFTQKHEKIQKKISVFKDEWNAFKMITNQQLQEYKEIVVNVQANILENIETKRSPGDTGNTDEIREQFSQWRKLTEQKNLNIFREITNAIKVQRMQWRKEHDEMQASIEENIKSTKQIKSTLSKKLEKANMQLNIQLKESLEGVNHKLEQGKEINNIIKKQLQEKIAISNAKLSENLEKKLSDFTKQMQSSLKDMENRQLCLKKSQQNSMNQMKQQITVIKVHTDDELQNLAKSIAQDNEQWQQEMKANEKKLKDYFTKQIEESASSKHQLIEAKNKQLQESFLALKKYAEKGFSDERNETVKQIMKVTEELTSLINDWSSKGKKERQALQNNLKEQISEIKKSSSKMNDQIKVTVEDIKKKNQQKQTQDEKRNSELKSWVESTISKTSKSGDQEIKSMTKKVDTLKIEIQGRLKASTDKLLLEINMKKQQELKAKEEEKSKSVEQQKKLADLYIKLKGEFTAQLSKTSKLIEDQSSKNNKKNEGLLGSLKKQMQGEVQKQRKYCVQQLTKLKGQLEQKIKAKQQKAVAEQNSKKDAQAKQKEDQLKAKWIQADKKLADGLSKLKTELLSQIGKGKTAQTDQMSKVKKQIQLKLKSIQEQKQKKQAESRGKQQQLKDKEKELKDRSVELDTKLQSTKKDIQKIIGQQISKAKSQINQKIQKSALQPVNKSIQQQKLRQEQTQKKLQDLKIQTDKKIAQLKGVSLTSMKNQEQQAKKAQDKKLQTVKTDLLKLIEASNNNLKENTDKTTKLTKENQTKFTQIFSLLKSYETLINKVEAGLFADRQKNKAVYDKMTADILDIADSITIVLTQMKPAEK